MKGRSRIVSVSYQYRISIASVSHQYRISIASVSHPYRIRISKMTGCRGTTLKGRPCKSPAGLNCPIQAHRAANVSYLAAMEAAAAAAPTEEVGLDDDVMDDECNVGAVLALAYGPEEGGAEYDMPDVDDYDMPDMDSTRKKRQGEGFDIQPTKPTRASCSSSVSGHAPPPALALADAAPPAAPPAVSDAELRRGVRHPDMQRRIDMLSKMTPEELEELKNKVFDRMLGLNM